MDAYGWMLVAIGTAFVVWEGWYWLLAPRWRRWRVKPELILPSQLTAQQMRDLIGPTTNRTKPRFAADGTMRRVNGVEPPSAA